jgi:hypothetical protein
MATSTARVRRPSRWFCRRTPWPCWLGEFVHTQTLGSCELTYRRMGEKFIEWSDNRYPIALNTILSMTSFYWFTESYGRAMWAYRTLMGVIGGSFPTLPFSTTKPFGYSAYHVELGVLPKSWAEHLFSNLAYHKSHDKVSRLCHQGDLDADLCVLGRALCGAGAARAVFARFGGVHDACCERYRPQLRGGLGGSRRQFRGSSRVCPAAARPPISRLGKDAVCCLWRK